MKKLTALVCIALAIVACSGSEQTKNADNKETESQVTEMEAPLNGDQAEDSLLKEATDINSAADALLKDLD